MTGVFTGLMMGASKQYWLDVIQKIQGVSGNDEFGWSDIQRKYPDITKSDLTRLKSSGFIMKSKLKHNTRLWKLNPDCIKYINPSVITIIKKKKKLIKKL